MGVWGRCTEFPLCEAGGILFQNPPPPKSPLPLPQPISPPRGTALPAHKSGSRPRPPIREGGGSAEEQGERFIRYGQLPSPHQNNTIVEIFFHISLPFSHIVMRACSTGKHTVWFLNMGCMKAAASCPFGLESEAKSKAVIHNLRLGPPTFLGDRTSEWSMHSHS